MKELTLNTKLWIAAGVGAAIFLGIAYYFYTDKVQPYILEVARLDREITMKTARLNQILAQKQRLDALENEIAKAREEFAELKEMFPDEEVIPRRLFDLTTVSRKSMAIPTRFLPLSGKEKEFYKENHYAITISAGYHALGRLFSEIANFKYPTVIRKMKIEQEPQLDKALDRGKKFGLAPKTLVASFELTTFTSKK